MPPSGRFAGTGGRRSIGTMNAPTPDVGSSSSLRPSATCRSSSSSDPSPSDVRNAPARCAPRRCSPSSKPSTRPSSTSCSSPGPTCSTGGTGVRIEGLRASRRLATATRYEFATKGEALLWLADAVAGAAGLSIGGDDDLIALLGDRLITVQLPATL